ncbi:alpha/beta hydrolase [Reichenbachiella ulvae]|uniref:Lysophospholipase n=1 Tax=Reichenbachiella ulvae TaxID=2980104 RepID=A0ABT3CQQ8_9BACT|nr:lysophospholipase [Reichenbachiella ulvae]MCV9386030.1 lysophospholipase [Reichenbachiella ulvae]
MIKQSLSIILVLFTLNSQASERVTFKAEDGVEVVADLHMAHPKTAPMIVLFHQAGWSRGEYLEIAPTLNRLGYNCLAVDLRSGNLVNGVRNETNKNARALMRETQYVDAYQDIAAAVEYSRAMTSNKLILWGSSYSSALVIKYAGDNPGKAQAVLSFSPGEYFRSQGKPGDWIKQSTVNINCPVFIASARNEIANWQAIYDAISASGKMNFTPSETLGNHGSSALWVRQTDHKEYWEAVVAFLKSLEPPRDTEE